MRAPEKSWGPKHPFLDLPLLGVWTPMLSLPVWIDLAPDQEDSLYLEYFRYSTPKGTIRLGLTLVRTDKKESPAYSISSISRRDCKN